MTEFKGVAAGATSRSRAGSGQQLLAQLQPAAAYAGARRSRRRTRLLQLAGEVAGSRPAQLLVYEGKRQLRAGRALSRHELSQLAWVQLEPRKLVLAFIFSQAEPLVMRFTGQADFQAWAQQVGQLARPWSGGRLLFCSPVSLMRRQQQQQRGDWRALGVTNSEVALLGPGVTCHLRLAFPRLLRCLREGRQVMLQYRNDGGETAELHVETFSRHEATALQETLMRAISLRMAEPADSGGGGDADAEAEAAAASSPTTERVRGRWSVDCGGGVGGGSRRRLRHQLAFEEDGSGGCRASVGSATTAATQQPRPGARSRTLSLSGPAAQAAAGIPLGRIRQAMSSAAAHYSNCRRGLKAAAYQPKSLDLWCSMELDEHPDLYVRERMAAARQRSDSACAGGTRCSQLGDASDGAIRGIGIGTQALTEEA